MSEHQDLVALCHMLPIEIVEIIRKKVNAAKLQEWRDMGWQPVLAEIHQLEKKEILQSFSGKRLGGDGERGGLYGLRDRPH